MTLPIVNVTIAAEDCATDSEDDFDGSGSDDIGDSEGIASSDSGIHTTTSATRTQSLHYRASPNRSPTVTKNDTTDTITAPVRSRPTTRSSSRPGSRGQRRRPARQTSAPSTTSKNGLGEGQWRPSFDAAADDSDADSDDAGDGPGPLERSHGRVQLTAVLEEVVQTQSEVRGHAAATEPVAMAKEKTPSRASPAVQVSRLMSTLV